MTRGGDDTGVPSGGTELEPARQLLRLSRLRGEIALLDDLDDVRAMLAGDKRCAALLDAVDGVQDVGVDVRLWNASVGLVDVR
jgi:hypothetical protein